MLNNSHSRFAIISIGILFVWILLFAFLPQVLVFVASFLTKGNEQMVVLQTNFENYTRLADPIYLKIFWDSFVLALITALLCLVIAYPFAAILARTSAQWRPILLILIIIPFWTSSLVRTYALIAIIKTKGLLNALLLWLGIISAPLELMYTETAVFIGMVYTLLPFMILPLFASIEKIDPRLLEAAGDLGAGFWNKLVKITIPLTMPGIIAGFMLVFLPALGMFYIPDLLGGAKNLIIGSFIRNQFLTFRDWPFGSAASMLLTFLMLALVAAYYRSHKAVESKDAA